MFFFWWPTKFMRPHENEAIPLVSFSELLLIHVVTVINDIYSDSIEFILLHRLLYFNSSHGDDDWFGF